MKLTALVLLLATSFAWSQAPSQAAGSADVAARRQSLAELRELTRQKSIPAQAPQRTLSADERAELRRQLREQRVQPARVEARP